METTFMTPNAVVPALAAACAPSVKISPLALSLVAGAHATGLPMGESAVAGLPVAQLPALRQLAWNPSPIKVAAAAGATSRKRATSTISTTSSTLAYRNQEFTGIKLDGFGGVPPRGKPKV